MGEIHQNLLRKEGYYWVKTEHKWHIALWSILGDERFWRICWSRFPMYDQDFLEIDEKQIYHQEKEMANG